MTLLATLVSWTSSLLATLQETPTPENPFGPITPVTPETPYTAPLDGFDGSSNMLETALDDVVVALGGEALFGLLFLGAVNLVWWVAGGRDLAVPAVFTILVGAMAFPLLPGSYVGLARAIIVLGGASMLLELARRYVLDPGAR
ncbi:hypothetical protein [Halomarina oriensis]|uniref:Uncharacterized protein n=1 Tax=Halomarina oriensis TaxID=671145 RepID=A0A6B0GPH6_9EURY|nr:hypothetical protein [Halomarina oriensis]MWG35901.1 hypothetical protein [Halomarina oriensis]